MVNDRLFWFIETNCILTEYQSGFRKNRSTIDQLIRLESAVRETFIKPEHIVIILSYLKKDMRYYLEAWHHEILPWRMVERLDTIIHI